MAMNVSLTPELERYVNQKIESGLYQTASEVVRAGLRLLKEREDLHRQTVEELRRELQVRHRRGRPRGAVPAGRRRHVEAPACRPCQDGRLMAQVLKTPRAQADLEAILDELESKSPPAAERFAARVDRKCLALGRIPELGRARDEILPRVRSTPVREVSALLPPPGRGGGGAADPPRPPGWAAS